MTSEKQIPKFETRSDGGHDAIDMLIAGFDGRRQRNANYSLRAFAKQLGVNSGALSQVMSRKRPLTLKMATKIAEAAFPGRGERQRFLRLSDKQNAGGSIKRRKSQSNEPAKLLREDAFRVIKDWHHFAILSLVGTKGFECSVDHVAERLGIDRYKCEAAIKRLESGGYLRLGPKWKVLIPDTKTTTDIPSRVIRDYHKQRLIAALQQLDVLGVDDRDYSAVTFRIEQKSVPKLKQRIKDFRRSLIEEFEVDGADEVYNVNIQMLRLSKALENET